jgi:hypothetical protein
MLKGYQFFPSYSKGGRLAALWFEYTILNSMVPESVSRGKSYSPENHLSRDAGELRMNVV